MRPRRQGFLAFAVFAAAACLGHAPVVGDDRPGRDVVLITPALAQGGADAVPGGPVRRRRAVHLDLKLLRRAARHPGGRIRLDLFADVPARGVIEQVEWRAGGGFSVSGRLDGEGGSFALAVEGARLSGGVRLAGGALFSIGSDPDGTPVVVEVDPDRLPECAGAVAPAAGAPSPEDHLSEADPRDVIDVLVVYTERTESAVGGPAAANALAQRAVDEANQAYAQSGITTRLRLVGRGRVDYDETGGTQQDHLLRLRLEGDGFLDEVHALRNATGADVVSLLVDDDEGAGVGYLMQHPSVTFEGLAFSVVYWFAASNNLSLAHEVGHNQGCEHDRDNATMTPAFNYAYGRRFTGNDARVYRTVMGYLPGFRIARFSNPNVLYEGQPTGRDNKEDNARAINNTAVTVANFRSHRHHPGSVRDFDGNGFDDLAIFDAVSGDFWVGQSRGAAFDTRRWGTLAPPAGWGTRLEGDFDGDGWKDVAAFLGAPAEWWVGISRGDRFDPLRWGTLSPAAGWGRQLAGDFNGDGRDDILNLREPGGSLWVSLSSGAAFATTQWGQLPAASGWGAVLTGDFDGDGRADVAGELPSSGDWWMALSTGAGFTVSLWGHPASPSSWTGAVAGDFDGDGRDDIAGFVETDGTLWVGLSTGAAFAASPWGSLVAGAGWGPFLAGDFDGDAVDDLAAFHAADAQWWIAVSDGSALPASPWSSLPYPSGWTEHHIGDFDGDGRMDIASYNGTKGEWWVGASDGTQLDTTRWARFVLPHAGADTDGDGASDAEDCDPTDGAAWALPGEVTGLILDPPDGAGAPARLRWPEPSSPGGLSVHYDVLRSTSPWYFQWNDGICLETDDADREALDAAAPSPIFYYLVRAGNGCGEGAIGAGVQAGPRLAVSCP